MNLQLFGIPNCGTCKKALQWLKQAGIEAEFINLKEQPPSEEQIQTWVTALSSKALRNTSGKSYRALPPSAVSGRRNNG